MCKSIFSLLFVMLIHSMSHSQNLYPNGGFEGGQNLKLCGGAERITKSNSTNDLMIRSGQSALKIYRGSACGSDLFLDHLSLAEMTFDIPQTQQEAMTVVFHYSRIHDPIYRLLVGIATTDDLPYEGKSFADIKVLNLEGWHSYKFILEGQDFQKFKGRKVKLYIGTLLFFGDDTSNTPLQGTAERENAGFYIDDLNIAFGKNINSSAAIPSSLKQYGSQTISYIDYEASAFMTSQADGTNKIPFAPLGNSNPISPVISPDGKSILYFEEALQGNSSLEHNPAQIYILYAIDRNGQNKRELFRSSGIEGFEPINPTPSNPSKPALDVQMSQLNFSADGKLFSLTKSTRERYKNGSTGDASSFVEVYAWHDMKVVKEYLPGYNAWWTGSNSLVYVNNSNVDTKATGIYEVSDVLNGVERLIVAGTGGLFGFSPYQELAISASQEGNYVSSIRYIDGYFTNTFGSYYSPTALMIFEKEDGFKPKQVLLFDHGTTSNGFHMWSPDGKFIVYHLQQSDSNYDIWWFEVETGLTGKLTHNNSSLYPYWNPFTMINSSHETITDKVKPCKMYPTTFSESEKVEFQLHQENTMPNELEIYNMKGQLMYSQKITSLSNQPIGLPITVTQGQYFLQLKSVIGRCINQFVVLK